MDHHSKLNNEFHPVTRSPTINIQVCSCTHAQHWERIAKWQSVKRTSEEQSLAMDTDVIRRSTRSRSWLAPLPANNRVKVACVQYTPHPVHTRNRTLQRNQSDFKYSRRGPPLLGWWIQQTGPFQNTRFQCTLPTTAQQVSIDRDNFHQAHHVNDLMFQGE